MRRCLALGVGALGWLNLTIAGEPRWTRIVSPNFEMYTTAGERSARDTFRFFEQVRSFFLQTMPASSTKSEPVRIVAFSSMKEYEPYRLNEFAIAYYRSSGDHDYVVMSQTGAETFPIAIHEYVHLVMRHSKRNLPPWLNEGIAELYSTLKPMGDKILVGSLIAGRRQALLQDKWVPLATIMGAGIDSPYYNEKDKAGALYNEGWALTHMLALSPTYRPGFAQAFRSIAEGTPSAQALEKVYGKPMSQIEKDLVLYLRGERFQGVLFPVKLEKTSADLNAEPADAYDVKLLLAEVKDMPSNDAESRQTLDELIAKNPKRSEAYVAIGYLDWRQGREGAARKHFAKAFDLGNRNAQLLWDFGRMEETSDAAKSMEAFRELLKQDPEHLEARLELGLMQLRTHAAKEAVQTLAPVKKVTPEYAPRLLTLLAYAHLEAGDRTTARTAANQLKQIATNPEDRDRADSLLRFIEHSEVNPVALVGPPDANDARPTLQRRDSTPAPAPPVTQRPSYAGIFLELECGVQAKVIVSTLEGKKRLIIEDPTKVAINGSGGETRDLTCGPQKPAQIRVGYDPAGQNRPGIDGVVRSIQFAE